MWCRKDIRPDTPAGAEPTVLQVSVGSTGMGVHGFFQFSCWCNRARRMALLMAGILVLSVADLVITLAFLRAHWMMEANPIAAYLIRTTQSPWSLVMYKALTVGICLAVLYKLRARMAGEFAAWCSVGILAVMSVMWHNYSKNFDDPQQMIVMQAGGADEFRLGLP